MYDELDKQIAEIKQKMKLTGEKELANTQNIQDSFIWIKNIKVEFETRRIIEDKLEMRMPKMFQIMEIQKAKTKYPSENRPAYIFTNPETTIDLTFTYDLKKAEKEDIPRARDLILQSVKKTNPSLEILEIGELRTKENLAYYFTFFSPALDGTMYNFMFFLLVQHRCLLGNFNCNKMLCNTWSPIAKQMVCSIRERKRNLLDT